MNNNIFEACMNEHNKLDGPIYENWMFKMQSLLEAQSAWMIVNGDELRLVWDQQQSQFGRNKKAEKAQC